MSAFRKVVLVAASAVLGALVTNASAQDFPNRAIRLIVPSAPGGSVDGSARILQPALAQELGQSVVVENLPGAGNTIGVGQAARSEPDGYTIVAGVNGAIVMAPHIHANLAYDPVEDLRAIGIFGETYLVLAVRADSDYHSLEDIITAAKEQPGELTYGSPGFGSGPQIAAELLNQKAGIDIAHIPFQGGAPVMESLLGGHIDMGYGTLAGVAPHVESGAVRILAAAEPRRIPALPDVPTMEETVEGVETTSWIGLFAPKAVPDDVMQRLSDALVAAMQREDVIAGLNNIGVAPYVKPLAEADEIVVQDIEFWREAVAIAGIQPQ